MNFGTLGAGFGGLGRGGATSAFPESLFAGGYTGFFFDPSRLASLAQVSDGTGAVAADADPVGRMLDLSGNGNHVTQGTSGARPLYKTSGGLSYLLFDGVNDDLRNVTAQLGLTDMTIMLAIQEVVAADNVGFLSIFPSGAASDHQATDGIVWEGSSGTFDLAIAANATGTFLSLPLSGTGTLPLAVYEFKKTSTTSELLKNGVSQATDNTFTMGSLSGGGFMFGGRYLGSISGSYKANIRLYAAFCINRTLSASESTALRAELSRLAGL